MKGLSDQAALNQIIMPGSHDAGMSQTEHCSFGVVSADAQTQDRAITNKLLQVHVILIFVLIMIITH